MSYQIYKMVHFTGIFMVIMALAGWLFASVQQDVLKHPWRKYAAIGHGVGLFLVLLGGFGMLARLGIVGGLPGWIYGKLAMWLILGLLLSVAKRKPGSAKLVWVAVLFVSLGAAYLALYKPF